MYKRYHWLFLIPLLFWGCKKEDSSGTSKAVPAAATYSFSALKVNGASSSSFAYKDLNSLPVISVTFSDPVNSGSIKGNVLLTDATGIPVEFISTMEDGDKTIIITPATPLKSIAKYLLKINTGLLSKTGNKLQSDISVNLYTAVDGSDKFAQISDEELLTLVQKQTFKYFWDFGHPVSGLSRERNTSGNIVTTGGSGFGIMALVTGIHRNFISRAEGLARMQKVVAFLKGADRFHGAFPHWLDGNTGKVVPFSSKDNGGDLVETSYLMSGLLTARQYFNGMDATESALRGDINSIYNGVEWSWYRKDNSNTLYWHWSPNYNWEMNMPVKGWNESLITYVMAASSPTFSIPKAVYDNGWAQNGSMKNGNTYFNIQLPLGPDKGGPLFFSQYSFMGINPNGLSDNYANYQTQNTAHSLINYNYCKANPKDFSGYSDQCWGLTASDDLSGYLAHEPNNDNGTISPTAAISSFPYTPVESMKALKFFYYKLGDKTWGEYGFYDAFNLNQPWFANSYLAIDQGPIIVMIENHRSGLLWDLFMSCPEIKIGMKGLGFQSPKL